jgi:hypothetical protein
LSFLSEELSQRCNVFKKKWKRVAAKMIRGRGEEDKGLRIYTRLEKRNAWPGFSGGELSQLGGITGLRIIFIRLLSAGAAKGFQKDMPVFGARSILEGGIWIE